MGKTLSVAIITKNEEANLRRTLESIRWANEIVVVDSGSTDKTVEIASAFGAKVIREEWRGFGRQKNYAIEQLHERMGALPRRRRGGERSASAGDNASA